jgi:hypothetical protein
MYFVTRIAARYMNESEATEPAAPPPRKPQPKAANRKTSAR